MMTQFSYRSRIRKYRKQQGEEVDSYIDRRDPTEEWSDC